MREIIIPLNDALVADDSIYGVRVRGAENAEGQWEGRVEFESRSGIRVTTAAETTLSTKTELEAWAERLEETYLQDALRRASEGAIEKAPPLPKRT
jgi:hypothetical protein